MAMWPHNMLDGQYPTNTPVRVVLKAIALSGGLASGITFTGYAPSFVIGVPKTIILQTSKIIQPLTVSTITGSKIWCRGNTMTPTGAMAGPTGDTSFYCLLY